MTQDFNNGLMFTFQLKEGAEELSREKQDELYDKLIRLADDYGFTIDKFGKIEFIQKGVCKSYKKEYVKRGYAFGKSEMFIKQNKALNSNTLLVDPDFKYEEYLDFEKHTLKINEK